MRRCSPAVRTVGFALAVWTMAGPRASAQGALEDLQGRREFGPAERARLDRWIADRIEAVERAAAADHASGRAWQDFVERLADARDGGTPGFQEALAAGCSAAVADRILLANRRARRALLGGLAALEHPATLDAYRRVAAAPDPAVRLLAIRGVRRLIAAGVVPDTAVAPTVGWLTSLGQRESHDVVLAHLFAAFVFPGSRDIQARGIVGILEARRADPPAAADIEAFRRLQALIGSLPDAELPPAIRAVAAHVAVHCHRVVRANPLDVDDDLVRAVVLGERLLTRVTSVRGGLAEAIAGPEAQRRPRVLQAARTWFGSGSAAGALNGGRWQVPVGGGVPGVSFED